MEYNITMERTQRVAVTFTADNDEEALEKARTADSVSCFQRQCSWDGICL